MKTTIPLLLIFTSINVLISVGQGITPDEQKCLEDDKVWKNQTGECKSCKPCYYGMGRDFSHLNRIARKPNGDMRCPLCIICPKGSYSKKQAVKCLTCVVNCTKKDRHVQNECTHLHDATCGACLPGFYDKHQNNDFPCIKDPPKLVTVTIDPYKHTSKSKRPPTNNSEHVGEPLPELEKEPLPVSEPPELKSFLVVGGVVGIILAILISLIVIAIIWKKKPCRTRKGGQSFAPGSEEGLISLSEDTDLETDAVEAERKKNIGRRVANYNRQDSNDGKAKFRVHPVRQISFENSSPVRAENTISLATSGPNAIHPIQWSGYERIGKNCRCVANPSCDCCNWINTGPQCVLKRSDPVFITVSTNVCHDPTSLFQALGIPDAAIYQINNDRDRDPQGIPESETVLTLLNKWVEIEAKCATLQTLCTGLCRAGFHLIAQKIINDLKYKQSAR